MKPQYWLLCGVSGIVILLAPRLTLIHPTRSLTQPTLPHQQVSKTPQSSSQAVQQDAAQDIYRRVNPAVVTLYSAGEIGSGSIIGAEGLILTNKHVVQNGVQVEAKTASGKVYTGQVVAIDLRHDLALVQLATRDRFPTVPLASSANLQPGEPVYAIGSPAGRAGTFTNGHFQKVTEYGSLQTSRGLLQPGNSGGPLLNHRGEMIGINKGLLEDNSGLASSVTAAKALLDRHQAMSLPSHKQPLSQSK